MGATFCFVIGIMHSQTAHPLTPMRHGQFLKMYHAYALTFIS
jgi:hypothetical protein